MNYLTYLYSPCPQDGSRMLQRTLQIADRIDEGPEPHRYKYKIRDIHVTRATTLHITFTLRFGDMNVELFPR